MPWWGYVMTAIGSGFVLAFWGWVAKSIVKLGKDVAVIQRNVAIREKECDSRLKWLVRIEEKLDKVGEDTAAIKGFLEKP